MLVCRTKIQTDTYGYALNAGVHMRINSGTEVYTCMYVGSKYRRIHTDMHRMQECIFACIQDQNTDRYIQICTECRSAYLHVCRIKIQTDTYRYAQNAGVQICMYSGSKYRQTRIHTDMHRMQECIFACIQDQNADRYIQICTECRSAYLNVSRIKIQTDTCRYALDA